MSSRPVDLEGLPWPEGDPAALRASADHLAGLAAQLDAQRLVLEAVGIPMGWWGAGASAFDASSRSRAASLGGAAGTFRGAAGGLAHLAGVVEHAQEVVTQEARKLHDAREHARSAARQAAKARSEADAAHAAAHASPFKALGGADPLHLASGMAEGAARIAEGRAQAAAGEEARVEREARRRAEQAVADVHRADQGVAGELGGLSPVPPTGVGAPASGGRAGAAANPLVALGQFLGAPGGGRAVTHGAWLAERGPEPGVAERKGEGDAEWLRQLGLTALVGDGLRAGVAARTEKLTETFGKPPKDEGGGPPAEEAEKRLVKPRDLPKPLRGAFESEGLRTGLRRGLPAVGVGIGGFLDYEQARTEGHSAAGSVRRSVINTAGTTVGTGFGEWACGTIGAASLGAGLASCPILVPGGAWVGHKMGEGVNHLIDAAEPALKSAGHGLSKGIHDLKHALPHEPKPVLWDGNVVPGRLPAPGGGAVA